MLSTILITVISLSVVLLAGFYLVPRFSASRRAFEMIRSKQYEEALPELLRSVDANPNDFVSRYYLALLYSKRDEIDMARRHFREILERGRFNEEIPKIDVLLKLAALNMKVEMYDNAFLNFYRAHQADPNNKDALFQLGMMTIGQEEFDMAQRYLSRYIQKDKYDHEAHIALGVAYNRLNKHQEAEDHFLQAVLNNSDSKLAKLLTGLQLLHNQKPKEAYEHMQKIAEPKQPELYFFIQKQLAFLKYKKGEIKQAIYDLEDLKKFAKQNQLGAKLAPLLYDLGMMNINLHDWTFGSAYLSMVEYMDPDYPQINEPLQELAYVQNGDEGSERKLNDIVKQWEHEKSKQTQIYELSSLKSPYKINIRELLALEKAGSSPEEPASNKSKSADKKKEAPKKDGTSVAEEETETSESIVKMEYHEFERLAYQIARAMELTIDRDIGTYPEKDGLDLLCREKSSSTPVLVAFRRWNEGQIGEIEVGNMIDYMQGEKIKRGYLFTTTELTEKAQSALEEMPGIAVYRQDDIEKIRQRLNK